MGKQKQQVISRFFAPKPKATTIPSSCSSSPPSQPQPQSQQIPPPKIATTVSFSTAKRKVISTIFSQTPKKPRLSPHTLNPTPSLPELPEPSLTVPQSSNRKYTPLEQQVVDLKNKYPDVLLMIEVGYKFRFFGEDAEVAAKVLGIYAHMDRNFMTASVPTFRLNVHVRRLVSAGYKVGVVKQTETAAIKAHGPGRVGPFGRGLSALYTKATLEAAEDVGGGEDGCGGESNYLVCVVDDNVSKNSNDNYADGVDVRIGVVAVEISTGDVVHGEFNDGITRSGLEAVLLSLAPAELLLGHPLSKQTEKLLLAYAGPASNVRVECVSRDCFRGGGALAEVTSLFEKKGAETLSNNENQSTEASERGSCSSAIEGIMNMPDLVVQALALTICHLKQFGLERIMCLGTSFRSLSSSMEMTLSANTLQQLEVLRNNSSGSESGSLLHIMNYTLTTYGSRLLRHWVTHPLCDRNLISARLDAVSEIAESMGSYKTLESVGELDEENSDVTMSIVEPQFCYILSSVLTSLGRLPDIQRGITRMFHRTATPSEFIAVMQSILCAGKQLQQLQIDEECKEKVPSKTLNSSLVKKLILTASSATVVGKAAKLLSTLNKEAADRGDLSDLLIISNGRFPEVARARKAVQLAKEELDSLITLCRKQLGMQNLEFMSVSGTTHLIELPVDSKVPLNWVKVNSTKKTIRYHSPEVMTALGQLALANEELTIVCRAAWDSFLKGFGEYYAEFQAAVQALASLDCLHSLAILSRNKNYVRPVFVDNNEPVQIHICSGRHPVLDTILQHNFVPNDTNLHAEREYCQIITGPNMGGKSCYVRQVALIAIMAQVGSFVPASSAELHVLDGIYTRMGASDSIQQGRSTFLEELSEASHILHNCMANSLVIVDELGRGTSTHDGVAIAYATLHHLLKHKNCTVLFVTHYPKIADVKIKFPGSVGAYHVSYLTSHEVTGTMDLESDQDVTYLYKLVPGVSKSSFGFKVAELAQLPPSCISRATVMAASLEAEVSSRVRNSLLKRQLIETSSDQEEDAQENMLASPDSFHSGRGEDSEEFISFYRDLFLNLKFATHDDNPAKSFQFLKHARSIAKELLIR